MGLKKRGIIFGLPIVLVILSLTFVFAQEAPEEDPAMQATDIDISHSVRLNGFPDDNIRCNITMWDSDRLLLAKYQPMTYNETSKSVNWTLNSTQSDKIGYYKYDVTCKSGEFNQTETFYLRVNPTGDVFTSAQSTLYIFILLLSIGLFGLFFYWAKTLPFKNQRGDEGELIKVNKKKYIKIFSIVMCYLMVMWITYVTWGISIAYLYYSPIPNFFRFVWKMMLAFMYPIVMLTLIFSFILWVQDLKLEKLAQRGITLDG